MPSGIPKNSALAKKTGPKSKALITTKPEALEQDDPFLALSDIKKQLVLLVADVSKDAIDLTQAEIAAKLGIEADTVNKYLKDSVVLEAIAQYRQYHFRKRLELLFQNDLIRRYESATDPNLSKEERALVRLEKEDRQLVSRLFNLDSMPLVQINLNIRDDKLKGVL